jgi:hypothetical protein
MPVKITDELPTEGQFVVMHEYDGKLWAETYKYMDGKLHVYDGTENDVWIYEPPGCQIWHIYEPPGCQIWHAGTGENIKYYTIEND